MTKSLFLLALTERTRKKARRRLAASTSAAAIVAGLMAGGASMFHAAPARAEFVQAPDDTTPDQQTLLQADEITYDDDSNTVTARGYVEIQRGERILLADQVVYDRTADIATATGHVSMIDTNGTVFFTEHLQVTGDMKQGLAKEVRVLLDDKSRMASRGFRRLSDGISELYEAVYTPCDSCTGEDPLWQIKAKRVLYDRDAHMVYYHDAWFELDGVPIIYTPYLAHPDPTSGAQTGFLLPSAGDSRNLGLFYKQPYFINIDTDQEATITPFLTSAAGKGTIAEYSQDFGSARLHATGSLMAGDPEVDQDVRGHFEGWARWDLDDYWRTGTDLNFASDQTYLRRYGFKAPTWLTSNLFAERFDANSYFSANSYYFQNQRADVADSSVPIIAPLLNYNYVTDPDSLGGYWDFQGNGLVLFRETGTASNRISATVGWNLPYTASYGGVYTFRADVRGDGYDVTDVVRPRHNDIFSGTVGRFAPEISLKWQMPFVSDELGFHQVLEPIVMVAASPTHLNPESIPNEDSLDLEFDDTNLFGQDRYSGLDRVETGTRVNYALQWSTFNQAVGNISALFGQSYRFYADPSFTATSGLAGHLSDFVGHLDYTPSPYVTLQYRFRLDKDTLAPRRSEVTAALGPNLFRFSASYLFVKADGTLPITEGSTQELFVSLSSQVSRHWSVSASTRQNLGQNGGNLRTDLAVTYEDECFLVGLDIANDNTQDRDFKSGLAVLLRFNLKTIGDIKFNTDVSPH